MPKSKKRNKEKQFFRFVHLEAIIFLIVYYSISKTIFVGSVLSGNYFVNFLVPYVFGVVSGIVFLYLLKNDDCFHFMKDVEKREMSKEKKLIRKYLHFGKVWTTLIITAIAGPIFGALTIRFIFQKYRYSFVLLAIGNIFSTILTVGLAKGIIFGLTQ